MYKKIRLNYGRNSLKYIIRIYGIKKLFIPYYLCNVIRHCIIKENCLPVFYHIDNNFLPINEFSEDDYILYPNYFGICDENVKILTQIYKNIIIDNAHSFYSEPSGFACFNSERKFHPVNNGSFLWIQKNSIRLPYAKEEFAFNSDDIINETKPLMIKDNQILYNFKNKRKQIFEKYHQMYSSSNQLIIKPCISPFCYPYLAKTDNEADDLVKKLNNEGKIIYRYWNCLPESYNEYKFYKRLVPIPIDGGQIHETTCSLSPVCN